MSDPLLPNVDAKNIWPGEYNHSWKLRYKWKALSPRCKSPPFLGCQNVRQPYDSQQDIWRTIIYWNGPPEEKQPPHNHIWDDLLKMPTWHLIAAAAKSLQSCPTLCDPIDGSPPGSAIPGILQARTPEWAAISFSNAWKWKVKVKSLSHVWLLATPWTAAYQAPPSMGFSKQEYWSGVPLPSLWHLITLH